MKAPRRLLWMVLATMCAYLPLTGAPAADRGIGGTGAPASGPAISDRGIGGTGIVGVITGFGSVFVNGLEVAYTPATPLTVDGVSEPDAALRVGQLTAIVASDERGLSAVSIDVRHEVTGPVTSVSADGGTGGSTIVVAGQRVAIDSGTEGLQGPGGLQGGGLQGGGLQGGGLQGPGGLQGGGPQGLGGRQMVHPGEWVAVSGLRGPDGVIAASRIDQRMPGTILVRGPVLLRDGGWWIGDLAVQPPSGPGLAPGVSITARGTLVNGALSLTTADPDVLSSDPAAFFGSHVRRMVIESYVRAADGHVQLGREWLAAPVHGFVVPAGAHRAIVEFERGIHGSFVATHLRGAGRPFGQHGAPFAPERHGSLGPFHQGPHAFGPPRYQPRPWLDRHRGFGRGGYMRRRPR